MDKTEDNVGKKNHPFKPNNKLQGRKKNYNNYYYYYYFYTMAKKLRMTLS